MMTFEQGVWDGITFGSKGNIDFNRRTCSRQRSLATQYSCYSIIKDEAMEGRSPSPWT